MKGLFNFFFSKKKNNKQAKIIVLGLDNAGKTTILKSITGETIKNLPPTKGFNVKTKGLSIRYAEKEDHNLTILDSAGQETPLLNNNNEIDNEYLLRDKLNTELFIQKFIILKSKILFIVVVNFVINVLFAPVIFKLFSSTMVNHPFKLPVFGNFLYFLIPHRLHILQHILLVHLYQL